MIVSSYKIVLREKIQKIDPPFASKLDLVAQVLQAEPADAIQVQLAFRILQELDSDKLTRQAIGYFQRFKPAIQFLDLIRNIMVFIPILLTWFSLSVALEAYTNLGSETDAPFIYLWQSGFDGQLSEWLVFSNVAWADAIIVLGIIILTGITSLFNTVSEEIAINRAITMQRDINILIWQMQSSLIAKYPTLMLPQTGSFDAVVMQLEKLVTVDHDRSESIINMLAAEHERLVSFSTVQAASIEELKKASISFNQLSSEMLTVLTSFQQKLLHAKDVDTEKSILIDEAISKIDSVNSYLKYIKDDTNILNIKFSEFAKAQIGFLDEVGFTAGELSSFTKPIKQEFEKIYPEIKKLSTKLLPAVDSIQLAANKNLEINQKFGSDISQKLDKPNQTTKEKEALDNLLRFVHDINNSIKQVQSEYFTSQNENMRAQARQNQESLESIMELMNEINTSVKQLSSLPNYQDNALLEKSRFSTNPEVLSETNSYKKAAVTISKKQKGKLAALVNKIREVWK